MDVPHMRGTLCIMHFLLAFGVKPWETVEHQMHNSEKIMGAALLDVNAAAQRLTLSKSTLDKLRVKGRGPTFIKLGRAVRYMASDLDKWVAAGRQDSTSANDNEHQR